MFIILIIYLIGVIINASFILIPQFRDMRFWQDIMSPRGSDNFKRAIKTLGLATLLTLLSWVGTVLGIIYFMIAINAGT